MIDIVNKKNCCGCGACMQQCPKHCIKMVEDEEGFLYPSVDLDYCVNCHLCEKVCPVINQINRRTPLGVYAVKNPNEEIRLKSSSGGVFTMLAEYVIHKSGVVFGARFNSNWEVIHDWIETIDDIEYFRGSKYVQSDVGDSYKQAESFLKQGRMVLFSGTPCQILGLHRFLCKKYDNLLTVDVVCHGVPSPKVWRMYLKEIIARQCDKNSVSFDPKSPLSERDAHVECISFRDKRLGWKKYSFVLTLSTTFGSGAKNTVSFCEVASKNIYMKGFLKNLYLRPSCYACPARSGKSGSDFTIADFWGISRFYPEFDDDKGVGCVLIYTSKGRSLYTSLKKDEIKMTYRQALRDNPCIIDNSNIPNQRKKFWKEFLYMGIGPLFVYANLNDSFIQRAFIYLKRYVKRLLNT